MVVSSQSEAIAQPASQPGASGAPPGACCGCCLVPACARRTSHFQKLQAHGTSILRGTPDACSPSFWS